MHVHAKLFANVVMIQTRIDKKCLIPERSQIKYRIRCTIYTGYHYHVRCMQCNGTDAYGQPGLCNDITDMGTEIECPDITDAITTGPIQEPRTCFYEERGMFTVYFEFSPNR